MGIIIVPLVHASGRVANYGPPPTLGELGELAVIVSAGLSILLAMLFVGFIVTDWLLADEADSTTLRAVVLEYIAWVWNLRRRLW